ncbi:unnamed protein product [Protopolystoma xenopodis]|uniref:Uncharacterized protein n=1 Tax=Protopolystoma xenopodis TaxID=117903 RepID=A0A448XIA6_9PLAT|nr:unnamed protein product [Protopolystoma xenopodis]
MLQQLSFRLKRQVDAIRRMVSFAAATVDSCEQVLNPPACSPTESMLTFRPSCDGHVLTMLHENTKTRQLAGFKSIHFS